MLYFRGPFVKRLSGRLRYAIPFFGRSDSSSARMRKIPPRNRPYYPPTERLAILELRAVRAWSLAQTARRFLVEPGTIASWMKRVDEDASGIR